VNNNHRLLTNDKTHGRITQQSGYHMTDKNKEQDKKKKKTQRDRYKGTICHLP